MLKPQEFLFEEPTRVEDGIGGFDDGWQVFKSYMGFLDMATGTNQNTVQSAILEQSTHVLIITDGFEVRPRDKMRVTDKNGRTYVVTYVDDPVNQGHHLEVYLTYTGGA